MSEDPLERLAARFVAAAVDGLTAEQATIAFASPVCTRSPDIDLLWQRGLREAEPARITRDVARTLGRELVRGVARLLLEPRRYAWKAYGEPGGELLVATAICGEEDAAGRFVTAYVPSGPDDHVFVFGTSNRTPPGATVLPRLGVARKLGTALTLGRAGLRAARYVPRGRERRWLLWRWLSWALGGAWLHDLHLSRALGAYLDAHPAGRVGCIHEMHAYARVVWRVAAERGAARFTVQHAAVTEGKRWYFCEAEERAAGLVVPDVTFVFDPRVAAMLSASWGTGAFPPGCSGRYARWKDSTPLPPAAARPRTVLFAGALARFDNDALLAAARRLVRDGEGLRVRLRLHPMADVAPADRAWLDAAVSSGEVELSSDTSLAEDLAGAAVVVGMGTTVLEEALLLGRPVVRLADDRFVRYVDVEGVRGASSVSAARFGRGDVEASLGRDVDSSAVRASLGLDNPVVDYALLFRI